MKCNLFKQNLRRTAWWIQRTQKKIACRFNGRSVGTRPLGRYKRRGEIILKCIFTKWDGDARTRLIWLRI